MESGEVQVGPTLSNSRRVGRRTGRIIGQLESCDQLHVNFDKLQMAGLDDALVIGGEVVEL